MYLTVVRPMKGAPCRGRAEGPLGFLCCRIFHRCSKNGKWPPSQNVHCL